MRIWRWWIAITTDRKVWRVTYPDGKRTHPVDWGEARNLKFIFGGKIWIDYKDGWF